MKKVRVKSLISSVSENLYEREYIVALSFLAAVAETNTFLYGLPGTAKSLISRRIAEAFKVTAYFEYLMNRFSTPEELFGPISIKALKEDIYTRKTENYLPCADFVFLDEIWKASPAILNTLLSLVNEKTFKNGDTLQQVPLVALISASNEIPEQNQGLDALYDRFILRLVVEPITETQNFHTLLQSKPSAVGVQIDEQLKISKNELKQWREEIHHIIFPQDVLQTFDEIKQRLKLDFAEHQIYVSDRRWQRIAYLVKASAFLNDREQVLISDLFVLKHCLWNQIEDITFVQNLVQQAIIDTALVLNSKLETLVQEKDQLEQNILNHFYYTDDVYESYLIKEKEYLRVTTNLDQHYKDRILYLELNKMGTKKDFFSVDADGQEIQGIVCNFNGTRVCTLTGGYYGLDEMVTPYIKYTKGTPRPQISAQVKYELLQDVQHLKIKLQQDLSQLQKRFDEQVALFDSIFILPEDSQQLKLSFDQQFSRYELQIQDSERLEQICKN